MKQANVVIIGSGVAAFQLAKKLRRDINVIILTKSHVSHGNSYMAQGGVAAAIGENDNPAKHCTDTLEAGRFHNDFTSVQALTNEAPSLIEELLGDGCLFDKDKNGNLLLGMEGAHSENRIIHGGGDATGKKIMDFMMSESIENLQIIEHIFVFDILLDSSRERCIGVRGKYSDGRTETFLADHVVVASGGCGQLYSYTSNAETVTGDGIALAYRAGAEITDMEFIQFHPTLLYKNGKALGLVSEAVRGAGGRLVMEDGTRIMNGVHPLGDLAPRHIVSQTIYSFLRQGIPVFLDITKVKDFQAHFPTITALCEKNGIDLKKSRIPVVPGSHFLMGGIKTDLIGRSSIKGLYAIGEAACTGIHGANRLASNSLLEGLFIGKKLAVWINEMPGIKEKRRSNPPLLVKKGRPNCLPAVSEMKTAMMECAGIVRSKEGLQKQKDWLENFRLDGWMDTNLEILSWDEISRVFMLMTAWLITDSALKRTESRGGHFRKDYPYENDHDWLREKIIQCRKIEKDENDEQIKAAVAT